MDDDSAAQGLARFLTLADTAELLSIAPREAYELVNSGELPAIQVGAAGRWRVEREVLESYIEARYEIARRHALWNQSDFANVIPLYFP